MEEEFQNNNNQENIDDQTGNMYSYHDDSQQEPPKESNAIRRSIGNGANPNLNTYQDNSPIENIQNPVVGQFPESNAVRRSLGDGKNPNAQNYPSYIDNKSSEFRLPKIQDNKTQYYMGPPVQEVNPIYRPQPREPKKLYFLTFFLISIFHIIAIFLLFFCFEFPNLEDITNNSIKQNYFYHFFKDVHIMLFIGFGMLYTLLKDHQWSSVSLTLFMGSISIEFSLLCYFIWHKWFIDEEWGAIKLDFDILTSIDYFSTTVIITLGAVIGKLSISQYFVICIFEILFASLNFFLCYHKINFLDNGGSLFIHTFGGTFGVVLSVILFCRDNEFTSISNNPHLSNDYFSTVFSFIGTIFLWIFFPSFNVAKIQFKGNNNEKDFSEALRYRGIINTYLSMVGSLIGTFVFNPMIHNGKIKVEHLLNSSYVGGIIIGGCCTICTSGWASILIGFIGGSISVLCLWKIKSLFKKNKLEDTFGILNTFTIPGILGGFLTCIFIANLKDEDLRIYIFGKNFKEEANQAGLQVAAICVTLAIAGLSGIITGFVVYSIRCEKNEIYFVDSELFTEDENIPLPEWKYPRQNDSNLSSSGHKLDEQGREVQIDQV